MSERHLRSLSLLPSNVARPPPLVRMQSVSFFTRTKDQKDNQRKKEKIKIKTERKKRGEKPAPKGATKSEKMKILKALGYRSTGSITQKSALDQSRLKEK